MIRHLEAIVAVLLVCWSNPREAHGDNESPLGPWDNFAIAIADAEETCGVAEWDTNGKPYETLDECYERVMDGGALHQNDGRYWDGFLHARKRGLIRCASTR